MGEPHVASMHLAKPTLNGTSEHRKPLASCGILVAYAAGHLYQ